MNLKIKPLNEKVRSMYQNHGHYNKGDSGLDLFIINDEKIKPKETKIIHLGICCENLDNNSYFLMTRSSISKTPLRMSNSIGLIDSGYRGELMASVDNIYNDLYMLKNGQRLFQLVAMDGSEIYFNISEQLSETKRGLGGFGSTGS